jgi:hypothetical protein
MTGLSIKRVWDQIQVEISAKCNQRSLRAAESYAGNEPWPHLNVVVYAFCVVTTWTDQDRMVVFF